MHADIRIHTHAQAYTRAYVHKHYLWFVCVLLYFALSACWWNPVGLLCTAKRSLELALPLRACVRD
jgi:FtsH-binding integral membrane protein